MSTKKIIRQILIGAALTINATALSTLGQQQVNAMEQNKPENNSPKLTTEQEIQNLKQLVQQKSDEQGQEYDKFNATVKAYGDKITEIESTILTQLKTTTTDLATKTKDINETKEKLTKLNDQYKTLKKATQAMKASLEDQTNNTARILAINDKQAAEIAKQAAEIAQLKKDRQN